MSTYFWPYYIKHEDTVLLINSLTGEHCTHNAGTGVVKRGLGTV